jgi:hypothetical protein
MNPKLGGTNCTLTQRGTPRGPSFQQPPESISWLFDAKAMVVVSDRQRGRERQRAVRNALQGLMLLSTPP